MEAGAVAKMHSFKWKVNINSSNGEKKTGDFLQSPVLSFESPTHGKLNWKIILYPQGDGKTSQGHLSVYLKSLNKSKIPVMFRISLLDQNNKFRKEYEDPQATFLPGKKLGWNKFVPESYIKDSKNNILADNKLTILCCILTEEKSEDKDPNEETLCKLNQFEKLGKLLTRGELSDIIVSTSDGTSFNLHKCILMASSSVFEAMLRNDGIEDCKVKIEDVRPEVLAELFRFIYSGKVNGIPEIATELYAAAEKFCIEDLKVLCEKKMCNNLTKENSVEYLKLSIMNNHEKLKKEAIKCISLHLETLTIEGVLENLAKQHPEVYHQIVVEFFNN